MSEEINDNSVVTDETTQDTATLETSVTSSLEAQARNEGWVPKEEFQGNPENWADAKEFLRVGKIIKARDEKNSKLEKELKELKQITKTMLTNMQKAEQVAYEKATKDLETRLLRAKEIGDVEEALHVTQQQQELMKKQQQELAQHQTSFKDSEEFQSFLPKNNWVIATDRVSKAMQKVASELSMEYAQKNPRCTWQEELDYIHAEIRKEFPDRFKDELSANKQKAPAVLGTSSVGKDGQKDTIESKLSLAEKQVVDFLKLKGYDYKAYVKALNIK